VYNVSFISVAALLAAKDSFNHRSLLLLIWRARHAKFCRCAQAASDLLIHGKIALLLDAAASQPNANIAQLNC